MYKFCWFLFSHYQFKIRLSLVSWNNLFLFHLLSTAHNLIVVSSPIVFVLVGECFLRKKFLYFNFSGF